MNINHGVALIAGLLILALQKMGAGLLPEMLWVCHVATAMLAFGLVTGLRLLIATGFLFHIAVAVPAYALHLASGGDTTVMSFALHLAAPVVGWLACRKQPLPAAAPWLALGTYLVLMVVSRFLTPESMNVNVAFHPWGPFAELGVWPVRALNVVLMLGQLQLARYLWNRYAR